ncbi:MAG: histone deacetylase, partial [Deltaproteobacteria bacterium]|nr:histone deacetylase [Deltaproteobacteria bacterium]
GGCFEIDSTATPGHHVLAVHIPINACKSCIEAGYKFFDQADKNKFDKVFLQDRPKDIYEIK